jgi:hypothetical protein
MHDDITVYSASTRKDICANAHIPQALVLVFSSPIAAR